MDEPPSMLTRFETLGRELTRRWRALELRPEALPELASEALRRFAPWEGFERDVLVDEILGARRPLPPQVNLDVEFGEPPLCVYWSPALYIEILVWVGPRTNVHQHSFCGAFTILEGSSLQATYSFVPEGPTGGPFAWGELRMSPPQLLELGHVEPIPAGDALIHSVRHLARPTLSLVVRTHGGDAGGPQYDYFPPGLALDTFRRDPERTRRHQLLELSLRIERARGLERLSTLVARSTELERIELVHGLVESLRADDAAAALLEPLAGAERRRIEALLAELHRSLEIDRRAQSVTRPDHQLLLGLVELLGARAEIDDWLRRHRPQHTPAEWLERWLLEMHDEGTLGLQLDPVARGCLRSLLERAPEPHAGGSGLGARLRAQLDGLRRTLSEAPVWGALFR